MTLAKELVRNMGKKLIGRKVITPPMGSYPGGLAQVIEIHPDPAAPEIVFNVENPAWRDDNGTHVIGVFGYEYVELQKMQRGEGRGGRRREGWPGVPLDPVLACLCFWCDPPNRSPATMFDFLDANGEGKKEWAPPCDEYVRKHNKHLDLEVYCAKCNHPRKCHPPYREQYAKMREEGKIR